MSSFALRLSEQTRAELSERSRAHLSLVDRVLCKTRGVDVARELIRIFRQSWSARPHTAIAALEELVVLKIAAEPQSAILKEIEAATAKLPRMLKKRGILPEARVLAAVALCELGVLSAEEAKEQLGGALATEYREHYSAYTEARVAVLFSGARREKMLESALARLESLAPQAQVDLLLRLWHLRLKKEASKRVWNVAKLHITGETLQHLTTAALTLLLKLRREPSSGLVETMTVERLLGRPDRILYNYYESLAYSAYAISRSTSLQKVVRAELEESPPPHHVMPLVLLEFAKHGVAPMRYILFQLRPLMESEQPMDLTARLRILSALTIVGLVDPKFAQRLFDEALPYFSTPTAPWLAFVYPDAVYSFAIVDVLFGTSYTRSLFLASNDFLRVHYDEFDDWERMRIARAAMSVDFEYLPKRFRNSVRRILFGIERRPPYPDPSELQFLELLQEAMPEASVSGGGFVQTHHLDAMVQINGECYDAELDGRVHEVRDFNGRTIGTRGEDLLRDRLVGKEMKIVRFTRNELQQTNVRELIRKRFGLAR